MAPNPQADEKAKKCVDDTEKNEPNRDMSHESAEATASLDSCDSAPHVKRDRDSNEEELSRKKNQACNEEHDTLDLAQTLAIEPGDRLEVQWTIEIDDATEDYWWGATLLEHDGRTHDGVAIRTLDYDPYPDGGFPESSKEDVIFIGIDSLANYPSEEVLSFRKISASSESLILLDEEGVENMLNSILADALEKASSRFNTVSHVQKCAIAANMAAKKDKMLSLLREKLIEKNAAGISQTFTVQDVQLLMARTMSES